MIRQACLNQARKTITGAAKTGILDFYQLVIRETENMAVYGRWIYGLHPTKEMIERYVRQGVMYLCEEGSVITLAVAVTPYQTDDYHGVDWQRPLKDDEAAVVHLFAVNPRYQKKGYAKAVMKSVLDMARDMGMQAVRLDALGCNIPAHRLYTSLGFGKRDIRRWFAPNTGWTDFYPFEYLL